MALKKRGEGEQQTRATGSIAREAARLERAAVAVVEAPEPDATGESEGGSEAPGPQVGLRQGSEAEKAQRHGRHGAAFQMGPVRPVHKRRINIMVYGPYGHGKTTFAGSALDVPQMNDVLFIAADPGDMSLTSRKGLDIITINKYDQLARIFEYLVRHCQWRDRGDTAKLLESERELKTNVIDLDEQTPDANGEVQEGRTWFEEQRIRLGMSMDEPFRYRTVILDSISELHKYLIYKFTGIDIGKTKLDDEIEKMEEWPAAQELFRLLIRSFRDLPMNVIFVSAESVEPEKRNKRPNPLAGQALPKLAGQMAADIAGFIDVVGYLMREVEGSEEKRYLYLGAGYPGWLSKHRFENLPDLEYLENPTMQSLLDLSLEDAQRGSQPPTGQQAVERASSNGTRPVTSKRRRSAEQRSRG